MILFQHFHRHLVIFLLLPLLNPLLLLMICFRVLEVVCHEANGFTAADATQLVYVPLEGIIIIVLAEFVELIYLFSRSCQLHELLPGHLCVNIPQFLWKIINKGNLYLLAKNFELSNFCGVADKWQTLEGCHLFNLTCKPLDIL